MRKEGKEKKKESVGQKKAVWQLSGIRVRLVWGKEKSIRGERERGSRVERE